MLLPWRTRIHLAIFITLIICTCLGANTVYADVWYVDTPGIANNTISGTTHVWSPANGTIYTNVTIYVKNSGNLTILAGTIVVVNASQAIILDTQSVLNITGTSAEPVLFKVNETGKKWNWIFFNDTGSYGTLNYVNITGARIGLLVNSSSILIYNSKFYENDEGVKLINSSDIRIENCTFKDNNNYGLTIVNCSNIRVSNCLSNNTKIGLFIDNSTQITVSNYTADYNDGIWINDTSFSTFTELKSYNNTFGFNITGADTKGNYFKWCEARNNTKVGFNITAVGGDNTFFGCKAINNTVGVNVTSINWDAITFYWGILDNNTLYSANASAIAGAPARNVTFIYNWWGQTPPARTGANKVGEFINYTSFLNASLSAVDQIRVAAGTHSLALTAAKVNASISTTVPITLTVAWYSSNPGTSSVPYQAGSYVDVHINTSSGVNWVYIKLNYTGVLVKVEPYLKMFWWNGRAWKKCSDSGVNTTAKYIWARITSTTSPNIARLAGTPFSGGATPPFTGGFATTPPTIKHQLTTYPTYESTLLIGLILLLFLLFSTTLVKKKV
ncbi:MAG: hypothetical protein DRJ31_03630 [Candidatus Methanomethylicota archaeon]|uniref:Right handed beta helix domain-containing protein n=1 Tax=Thermoproteota archaeon TaxID=2056631 RepID=A0A497ERW1_9CREN|nr:MAG: hypothetical protein DRJ31_03630 [Candidatus Verstraetearchaeota archaeon]